MIRHFWPFPRKRKTFNEEIYFEKLCTSRDTNLQTSNLRMVLMDNDSSRRSCKRVIYDSSTVIPLLPGADVSADVRVSECKKFQLLRKKKDVSNLVQLVWGSGPASHGLDALKFHKLSDGSLMISRVFPMPRTTHGDIYNQSESLTSSDSDSQYTPTVRSLDTIGMHIRNNLNEPPENFCRMRNTSLTIESDESDEFRAFSPPHTLSKNRRIQMSHCSSLCDPLYAITSPLNMRKPRSRMSSIGSQIDEGNSSSRQSFCGSQEERQVALAVIFTSAYSSFVFQHIPLIEEEMTRLEHRIIAAAQNSKEFLENVYKAWEEFSSQLCLLFNTPRLRNPVWLALAEKLKDEHDLASEFCEQLASLIINLDNKRTNYFLSKLVSTVLMYHMSWVASVAAPHSNLSAPDVYVDRSYVHGTIVDEDFAAIPYNPHIAQFLEISGNIGNINRTTKTVVCGKREDSETISKLLQILSYFIRCSTVQSTKRDREKDELPIFRSFSPEFMGSPVSSTSDLPAFNEAVKMNCDDLVVPSVSEPVATELFRTASKLDHLDDMDFLGRSLLAGPSTSFSPHFIISGLIGDGTIIEKAKQREGRMKDLFYASMSHMSRMFDEVTSGYEPLSVQRAPSSMSCSQVSSSTDFQGPDSVIVVADISTPTVKVLAADTSVSNSRIDDVHNPSESVVSMFENFKNLQEIGTAPKFLINFLEDSLYSVLGKSLSLVELVSSEPDSNSSNQHLSAERVRAVLGCDHSDLRLILNVASVYYPCVLSSVT